MLLETYDRAHRRVTNLWGKASQYPCVSCGNPAAHWAYDWADPSSREDYSRFPEFYMPMCRGCHRRYDRTECYAVIAKVRRYTPGDQPFLEPLYIPPLRPPPPPVPKHPKTVPKHPKTEAEWDRYLAGNPKI